MFFMNLISRTVTGILMMLIGLGLIVGPLFSEEIGDLFVIIIYGTIVLVLGIVIFFNKKEDKIEGIRK